MSTPEGNLLKPRDQKILNPNDWPAFTISRVTALSQATGRPVSLLSAHKDNPVKVIGRLEEVEEQWRSSIRDPNYQRATIEIANVTTYAFAEFEGGGYGFWAAGQAGWFEIDTCAPSYKTIYDKMGVAASMLYYLGDKIRKSRKSKFTHAEFDQYIRMLFKDYLQTGGGPTRFNDIEDVKNGFHEHKEFLMTSMLEKQEGIVWEGTPITTYFEQHFSDDFARIKKRITGLAMTLNTKPQVKQEKSQPTKPTEVEPLRKKGRPRKDSNIQAPKTPVPRNTAAFPSSDEEDYGNPNVITRKRKSILQPSGSKYSKKAKKATGRRRSLPDLADPALSDNDEDEDEEDTPPAEESPIATIRDGDHLNRITNPQLDKVSPDGSPPPQFMPRKYLELTVVNYDLPSMEPQGPGDLWTCAFEGCRHRIRKATTATGKDKIKNHFKSHKSHAQEKIDLALDESRPYLPVNNLVRRLQAFAPSLGGDTDLESVGRKFSAPIRRKY